MEQERRSLLYTHVTDEAGTVWEIENGTEWHPDGEMLAITALSPGSNRQVLLISLDGSTEPERLVPTDGGQMAGSWRPDGKALLYTEYNPETENRTDIWEVMLDEDRSTRVLVGGPGAQTQPDASPDGQWLAYTSDHSGQLEVWVRSYEGPGRAEMASIDGGSDPIWSADGRELYFLSGQQILAVGISTEPELSAGTPRELFDLEGRYFNVGGGVPREFDLSPDGQHFLMVELGERWGTRLEIVDNWFEVLSELVPVER